MRNLPRSLGSSRRKRLHGNGQRGILREFVGDDTRIPLYELCMRDAKLLLNAIAETVARRRDCIKGIAIINDVRLRRSAW